MARGSARGDHVPRRVVPHDRARAVRRRRRRPRREGRAVRFENKMSDAEGLMWRLDKDPYLNSTFSSVTVLDRPADLDRLRRRLERASIRIPRLRQRVQSAPAGLSPPMWVDDPSFDLDY